MRDDVTGQYTGLSQRVVLLVLFSLVVISVAIAGLYGLIRYIADRLRKEMGLRKVLGANVRALLGLLSWQLLKPVIWASLLASPISALIMSHWLDGFVARRDVGFGAVASATLMVLLFSERRFWGRF